MGTQKLGKIPRICSSLLHTSLCAAQFKYRCLRWEWPARDRYYLSFGDLRLSAPSESADESVRRLSRNGRVCAAPRPSCPAAVSPRYRLSAAQQSPRGRAASRCARFVAVSPPRYRHRLRSLSLRSRAAVSFRPCSAIRGQSPLHCSEPGPVQRRRLFLSSLRFFLCRYLDSCIFILLAPWPPIYFFRRSTAVPKCSFNI